jgi:thiamine kinase-like enzyme
MENNRMSLTLDEAIARVPGWSAARDLIASPLGGGITNSNFKIEVGGEAFVLRIVGENTDLLGIDRDNEYTANKIAGQLGIAPEVYFFIRPEGYLVTRFINGRPIPPEEISQPGNIRRVMEVVKKIHTMPAIPGSFNVFQVVRNYTYTASDYLVELPKEYDWLIQRILEAEAALSVNPIQPCPCHNDLLNANFLTNDHLYILDWEYAGIGDAFFDLANFSSHHNLSGEQDLWMLNCYFSGEIKPAHWAHLQIMKIMSDLREASWGFVQIGISRLDFDFREYADKFYARVIEYIHNPQWNEYLKEVSKNV